MPNSLRAKVKHLAYKGILTQKESDKIRDALLKQKPKNWESAFDGFQDIYKCPNCKEYWLLVEGTPKDNDYNYCMRCGQKLKLEDAQE